MPQLEYIDGQAVYEPDGAILWEYLDDRSKVAVICGPIGSGSSSCSMMRLFKSACEQNKNPIDGVRRSRWAIVRPTYPSLETSTMTTWLKWFPEERYGKVIWSRPMLHTIRIDDVEIEVYFMALDGKEDIQKLRSTEWTGIFLNELEFQSFDIFTEARSRTMGRYPAISDGGCNWSGIIADMNAPPEDHFIARMCGLAPYPDDVPEEKRLEWPKGWFFMRQPPGLIELKGSDGSVVGYAPNPEAENQKWLEEGYYMNLAIGAEKPWIDSRIMNKVTWMSSGDPVWPGFKEEFHVSKARLEYFPGREIIVSLDFGRVRPCAIVAQEIGDRICILAEFRLYNVGATGFAPALKTWLTKNFPNATVSFTGDPKCRDKAQSGEQSSYEIFKSHGMNVRPPVFKNNNLDDRLEAVANALRTNRILISCERCVTLRSALSGKYGWRKIDVGEAEPIKDKFSDVADCLQYLCLFLGEGRRMLGLTAVSQARPTQVMRFKTMRRVVG